MIALGGALILSAYKDVPSPLYVLYEEATDNVDPNWYWVGALLPSNLVAFIHARGARDRARLCLTGAVVAFGCLAFSFGLYDTGTAFYVAAKGFAIFGVLALGWQARRPGGVERLLVVVMFATYLAIRLSYLSVTDMVLSNTLDQYNYAFDGSLGVNVAGSLFYFSHRYSLIKAVLDFVYVSVLVLPLGLYAAQTYRRDPLVVPALRVFLMASALGFACYFVFPACGPVYLLGRHAGDSGLPAGLPHPVRLAGCWRNAVPSLHFSLAVLMVLNVPRSLRVLKMAFVVYCSLTAMATMANGEHYLADLLAALPFVCAVQNIGLWLNSPESIRFLSSGLRSSAMFAGFLVFLIAAPPSLRTSPWSWVVPCILVAHFVIERRSWKASVPPSMLQTEYDPA